MLCIFNLENLIVGNKKEPVLENNENYEKKAT